MSDTIFEQCIDERGNISVRVSRDAQVITREEARCIEIEYKRMQDDSEKLRELVRYAYECAVHSDHATCGDCRRMNSGCILADRMRELGI